MSVSYDIVNVEKKYKNAFKDKNRRELQFLPFISIDNAYAQTLEDALCVLPNSKTKGCTLFIAISDVTSFISKNSKIEKEAILKPYSSKMIPEEINAVCGSFIENGDQIALVMQIEFNHEGEILSFDIYKAICRLASKLNFKDVENIIDNKLRENYSPLTIYTIKLLHSLAHFIRHPRIGINKKLLSLKIERDPDPINKLPSEEILKTFMTVANICAALFTMRRSKYTLVRQVGDVVKDTYKIKFKNLKMQKEMENFIPYSDFTSPLRRFAGIVIHRIIKNIIENKKHDMYTEKELKQINEKLKKAKPKKKK